MQTHKVCARCGELKPAAEFGTKPGRKGYPSYEKRYLKAYCHHCKLMRQVSKRFGLTADAYEQKLAESDGHCEICGNPLGRRGRGGFHLDHDHSTGAVRGFLCISCNTNVLPLIENKPELIEAARLYLKRYGYQD